MGVYVEGAINYMQKQIGKVTYSMLGSRTGTDGTADCSGMIYKAFIENGATKRKYPVSTETEHDWLIENGFELIAFNKEWKMQRGDVVILGIKGQSANAGGHTFIAFDNVNAIDCSWDRNGVAIRNENQMPYNLGWYVYRQKKQTVKPIPPVTKPKPKPNKINWLVDKTGAKYFYPTTDIWLREAPNTKGKPIMLIPGMQGEHIVYDRYAFIDGLVWLRQPRGNGKYGYMASGQASGNTRLNYWGEFY